MNIKIRFYQETFKAFCLSTLSIALIGLAVFSCKRNTEKQSPDNVIAQESQIENQKPIQPEKSKSYSKAKQNIPSKVYKIRDYVRNNGKAPDNYVGGRKFKNLEKLLPAKDKNGIKTEYREWDVNEKINGRNRGKERLITGSDGNDYYTGDHYKSFRKLSSESEITL